MSIFLKTAAGAAAIAPVGYESVWERTAAGAVKLYSSAALPTFDGSCAFFGDAKKGYIECYSSGTLTFSKPRTVDIFLAGGGAGGVSGTSSSYIGGGGGGSGYVQNAMGVSAGELQIEIGAGGAASANGGGTAATPNGQTAYTAAGGSAGTAPSSGTSGNRGGAGGSGGGGGFGYRGQSSYSSARYGGAGGSGIAIIRWGY